MLASTKWKRYRSDKLPHLCSFKMTHRLCLPSFYSLSTNDVETEVLCAYCFLEMIEKNGWLIVQEVRK